MRVWVSSGRDCGRSCGEVSFSNRRMCKQERSLKGYGGGGRVWSKHYRYRFHFGMLSLMSSVIPTNPFIWVDKSPRTLIPS